MNEALGGALLPAALMGLAAALQSHALTRWPLWAALGMAGLLLGFACATALVIAR